LISTKDLKGMLGVVEADYGAERYKPSLTVEMDPESFKDLANFVLESASILRFLVDNGDAVEWDWQTDIYCEARDRSKELLKMLED